MNLISRYGETFVRLVAYPVEDGLGGVAIVWDEGEALSGAMVPVSARVDVEAQKEKLSEARALYTQATLAPGEVLRRLDGRTWRVISPTEARRTPDGAGLEINMALIERWELV